MIKWKSLEVTHYGQLKKLASECHISPIFFAELLASSLRGLLYLTRNGPILTSSLLTVSLCLFVLALQVALELAEQVSAFPQLCLRADRNSAYHAVFDSSSFTQAMQYEFDHGLPVVVAEAVTGATKFSLGAGRGGTFSKSKL